MEIPPDSSFAQSTALCAGRSRQDVMNSILFQFPTSDSNTILLSSDAAVAASSTGDLTDFKYDNFREAYRMMNRPPKYPFQNIAQISNYKFDPYYFDGSENQANFNINENLIGTPLGTSLLEDPRLSYVKNLLTLREYEGQADQLNDSYIKELYMVNSEKGANYYQNMLENQKVALDNWSREGRKRKNIPIQGIAFTHNLPAGETARTKKKRIVEQTIYSETPSVQRNYRRDIFLNQPQDITDTVSTRSVTSRNSVIQFGNLGQITPAPNTSLSSSDSSSIASSSSSVSSIDSSSPSVRITSTPVAQLSGLFPPGTLSSPMTVSNLPPTFLSPSNQALSFVPSTPPAVSKDASKSSTSIGGIRSLSSIIASNENSSAKTMVNPALLSKKTGGFASFRQPVGTSQKRTSVRLKELEEKKKSNTKQVLKR